VIHQDRQPELLEVIRACSPARGLAGRLDCRQQQCHEDANNRNYNKKFNECETETPGLRLRRHTGLSEFI
jgi:hypothetical protein